MIYDAPPVTAESARFWQEAASRRLAMPYCDRCARWIWFPAARCDRCGGTPAWTAMAGTGRLLSYAIERRATMPRWQERVPYVIGLVRLDEGVTLLTNIVDCAPEQLAIGVPVRVGFEPTTDPGLFVPVFTPRKGL
jgi:uncharacterized OB-fold protein